MINKKTISPFICLKLLFVLNIFDAIMTFIGVKNCIVEEGNPLMINCVDNLWSLLLIKIGLISLIIILIYKLIKKYNNYSEKLVTNVCLLGTSVYVIITIMHFSWAGIYLLNNII